MKSFIVFMFIVTIGFGENLSFIQFSNKFQNDKASYEVFKSLGVYHCLDKKYNDKKNSNFHKEYLSLESDLFYLKKEKELFSKYPLLNLFSEAELLDAYSSYEKGSLFYVVKRSNFESEKDLKLKVFKEKSKNGQFNFIGYSWGGVIASRSALYYANKNIRIHHLVLIGAPIEKNLLQALQNHKNIGKVIIINLSKQGDPIYAGMKDSEIISAIPKLTQQMAKEGEGHFYYASEKAIGDSRRIELANRLYKEGLR